MYKVIYREVYNEIAPGGLVQRPKDVQRALDSARYFSNLMGDAQWLKDILKYTTYLESRIYGASCED